MKTLILYIFSLWFSLFLYGQNKYYFSGEFYPSYYYFDRADNMSYGFSLQASAYSKKVKLGTGINYMVKSYSLPGSAFYSIKKKNYNFRYINVPILLNIDFATINQLTIRLLTGFSFNKIIYYGTVYYYLDGSTYTQQGDLTLTKLGINFIIGSVFHYKLTSHFALNLFPTLNIALIKDNRADRPDWRYIPDDFMYIGANFGIEYIFGNNK